jgi:hypothetical protein
MTTTDLTNPITAEQERYAEAMDSAIDILFYYDADTYQSLAGESVTEDLTSIYGYSYKDACAMLATARCVYEYRKSCGLYN